MKRIFIRLFLFLMCVLKISAQHSNDTIIASQYFKKADSLLIDKKLDSSIAYFNKALSIYEDTQLWKHTAMCYNKIAENQYNKGALAKSMKSANTALTINNKFLKKGNLEEAQSYDMIGDIDYAKSNYSDAMLNYRKALKIKLKDSLKNQISIAKTYTNIGFVYRRKGSFDTAITYFKKNELIYKNELGENDSKFILAYNNIGNTYNSKGAYKKALYYINKAIDIEIKNNSKNSTVLAPLYGNLGIISLERGDYDKSLEYFNKALVLFIEELGRDHRLVSNSYDGISGVYYLRGEYDKSLEYSKKSLAIKLKKLDPNHFELSNTYINIANLYEQKREHTKALSYLNKSLIINKKAFGEKHSSISMIYHSIGNLYLNTMEYDLALDYHKKGLQIHQSILKEDSPKLAKSYFFLGTAYQKNKDFENSINNYKKSISILTHLYGINHMEIAKAYKNIGDCYYWQKKYDKALIQYENAFKANIKDNLNISDTNIDSNLDSFIDLNVLLKTLMYKANTLKNQYKLNGDSEKLTKSITTYTMANRIVNYIRGTFTNYKDSIDFAKTLKEIYKEAIESQILLGQYKNDSIALQKAFYYSEKSKANILRDLINDYSAKNFAGISTNLLEFEKELRIDLAFYKSKIQEELFSKKTDTTKIHAYENKLFNISRGQDSLTEVLEKNYPKYYELKYNNDVISVSDIQKKLNEKTTILEFFTTDSVGYAFVISRNNFTIRELPLAALTEEVALHQKAITNKNTEVYKETAYQLYNKLIAPIKDQFIGDELIIIPDGSLWHLNFELLLSQSDTSNNFKELSYMLREYAITYANSATLLFSEDNYTIDTTVFKEECLAFSFSESTTSLDTTTTSMPTLRATGDDLPGTRKEIKAIAEILNGNYYYGSDAEEASFKNNVGKYRILHLALHGEVDNEHPENSKLFFTKGKDTLEDNLLYGHELFALDIPAELTVLSACNTGAGKIAKGEGIMSLGTAFQYAGTKSLLLSSWEVSDQTTPELMKYFYSNLIAGMGKSKALQQAKLQFLNHATIYNSHPFYWGGFYLVGDSAPIQFTTNTSIYWYVGFGVIAIISLCLFWYKRKKDK